MILDLIGFFFFSSRRRHTRLQGDWSSDVCSSDLADQPGADPVRHGRVDGDQRHGLGAAPKYRPAALPAFHGSTRVLARPWPARATAAAGGGATSRRGSGSRPGEQARAMTRPPRITVFGTGYLGAAHAACLASLGL